MNSPQQPQLDAIHAREREMDERCARAIRRNALRHSTAPPVRRNDDQPIQDTTEENEQ